MYALQHAAFKNKQKNYFSSNEISHQLDFIFPQCKSLLLLDVTFSLRLWTFKDFIYLICVYY